MKTLFLSITVLLSFNAHALQFGTDWYSSDELYKNRQCQLDECRGTDFGHSFKTFCDFTEHLNINRDLKVGIPAGNSCYCPCNNEFIWSATH